MQYTPPFIPPRGEVNAADADCIGVFETQGVKTIKVQYYVAKICTTS
jgi:hypothetical protein